MKRILLFLSLCLFSLGMTAQTTVTVDASGQGDYSSISQALTNNSGIPSLTINVKDGDYSDKIIIDNTLNIDSIVIQSENSENPSVNITNSGSVTDNFVIKINSAKVTIKGINFINNAPSNSTVVYIGSDAFKVGFYDCLFTSQEANDASPEKAVVYIDSLASDIKFINNSFIGGSFGVYGSKIDNITIDNCEINDFSTTGIYITNHSTVNATNNIITGSESGSIFQSGITLFNCDHFDITSNFIKLTANNLTLGFDLSNINYSDFYPNINNNMISLNNADSAIVIKCNNISADFYFNNVKITNAKKAVIFDLYKTSPGNVNNNIFDFGNAEGFVFKTDEEYFSTYSDYNLFANNSQIAYSNSNMPYKKNYESTEPHSIYGDPQFISTSNLNIQNTDLVKLKGTFIPDVTVDKDGNKRKSIPDIGAVEVMPALVASYTDEVHWSGDVYVDSVYLSNTAHLIIEPGTNIFFNPHGIIYAYGNIDAVGSPDARIKFNILNPETDENWQRIAISGNNPNKFINCDFENASKSAIHLQSAGNTIIDKCNFKNNSTTYKGAAILSENSSIRVSNSEFIDNYADGEGTIAIDGQKLDSIYNCIFINNNCGNNNYELSISNDTAIIIYNTFYNQSSDSKVFIYTYKANIKTLNNIFSKSLNHNILFADENSTGIFSFNLIDPSNILSVDPNTSIDTNNNLRANPAFADEGKFDFHLTPISPAINAGTDNFIINSDFDGKTRPYNGGIPDMGAFEFQGLPIYADAGKDSTICDDKITLSASNPGQYNARWSCPNPQVVFVNPESPNTLVKNLDIGDNTLIWTVGDDNFKVSDTVIITNKKPFAYANKDINLVSDDFPNLITSVNVNASPISTGYTGVWTALTEGINILNPNSESTSVTNLKHGNNYLVWTVTDPDGCSNSDTLLISSGFNYYVSSGEENVNWSDGDIWNTGNAPQEGDFVSIYGKNVTITNAASVTSLVVSSSGNLRIGQIGKATGNLTVNNLYIEQNPQKFPKLTDTARLIVENGTVTINDATDEIQDGLIVGSLGEVLVDGESSVINVGKNRRVVVGAEQIKSYKATGNAQMIIRNGGRIYLEQTPQKITKSAGKNLYITSGGRIYIEQNPQKTPKTANTGIFLGAGNQIYIEQNPQKAYESGTLVLNGGNVYIEQTPQKKSLTKSNAYSLNIVNGGVVYLEQNPQKIIDSSVINVPSIFIQGGKLLVGSTTSPTATKAYTAKIRTNNLYIEQTPQKSLSVDSNLIIYPNSAVYITGTTDNPGFIKQGTGTYVTIMKDGLLDLDDNSQYLLEDGASLIDYQGNNIIATSKHTFNTNESAHLIASPIQNYSIANLSTQYTAYGWNQNENIFDKLENTDKFIPMNGYKMDAPAYTNTLSLNGPLNTGVITTNLNNQNQGINLLGNPYPSAIDITKLNLPTSTQSAIYIYDPIQNNFKIYQKDGFNLGNFDGILRPFETFFVVSNGTEQIQVTPDMQLHYTQSKKVSTTLPQNSIQFDIVGNEKSDYLAFQFDDFATENYNLNEDALKLPLIDKSNYVRAYSISGDNLQLAIDKRNINETTEIPIILEVSQDQDVTINISANLNNKYSVKLVNPIYYDTLDVASTSSYSIFMTANEQAKLKLLVTKTSNTSTQTLQTNKQTKIYKFNTTIYVKSDDQLQNISIFSTNGKVILNRQLTGHTFTTDLGYLKGVYIVKLTTNTGVKTQKLVF